MYAVRVFLLATICFGFILGCKSGSSAAGKYGLQQEGTGFGPGAEKTDLDLRADGTFDITLGNLTLATGKWKEEKGTVNLSGGGKNLGTNYKVQDGKLIPVINNKEVTFWRFVKKG